MDSNSVCGTTIPIKGCRCLPVGDCTRLGYPSRTVRPALSAISSVRHCLSAALVGCRSAALAAWPVTSGSLHAHRKNCYQLRQGEILRVLEKLRSWLDKTLLKALPKSAQGKALSYLDKNWKKPCVYVKDGRLRIDNNAAENAIRPFVIGREKLALQ